MNTLGFTPSTFFPIRAAVTLFAVFILCYGCSSIKPSTTKSGKAYFETFYAGEGGNQYFIKPLSFKASTPEEAVLVDMTFRYRDTIKDSSLVNFSITSPKLYKAIDSLSFTNSAMRVVANDVNLLYNEKAKKGFTSRFTTKIPLSAVQKMFADEDWMCTLYYPTKTVTYTPNAKTMKAIAALRQNVFILM